MAAQEPAALDQTFGPSISDTTEVRVYQTLIQPDGKILTCGDFTMVDGMARSQIARLNADGGLDADFSAPVGDGVKIYGMLLQSDGKILLNGAFSTGIWRD